MNAPVYITPEESLPGDILLWEYESSGWRELYFILSVTSEETVFMILDEDSEVCTMKHHWSHTPDLQRVF